IDLARDLDTLYLNLREEARTRLAVGMNVPPEIMNGKGGLNHWCVDTDTKILTREGWKTYDEVQVGRDEALTLNHETGLLEWEPILQTVTFEVEDLEMLSIEGDRHSSLSTLNHRWPVLHKVRENLVDPETGRKTSRVVGWERQWKVSEDLNSNDA